MSTGQVKLTNLRPIENGFLCDYDLTPDTPDPPTPSPAPPESDLNNTDMETARRMFLACVVDRYHLDAVAYQGRGREICAFVRTCYPTLLVFAHPQTDAIMWPRPGGAVDVDVTIDSGHGGWYFNPSRW